MYMFLQLSFVSGSDKLRSIPSQTIKFKIIQSKYYIFIYYISFVVTFTKNDVCGSKLTFVIEKHIYTLYISMTVIQL